MNIWGILFIFIFLLLSQFSLAQDLSSVEVYSKCYSRLSDFPVEINSEEYKKVAEGTLDPIDACTKLLDRATFKKSGNRHILKDENDVVARSVLRNLNQFHISWFTSLGEYINISALSSYNYSDATEPALFITDTLFSDSNFKSILTRNQSVRGIRKGDTPTTLYTVDRTEFSNRPLVTGPFERPGNNITEGNWEIVDLLRVPQGYLIGIESAPKLEVKLRFGYYKDRVTSSDYTSAVDDLTHVDLTENYGGGILGSQPYITSNSESFGRPDGGNRVYRRLANNTFNDLMCLTLPTLLNSDVDNYMEKYKASELSFRRDQSCARCHATLDPFAHTLRNISFVNTTTNGYRDLLRADGVNNALNMVIPKKYKVRVSAQSNADSDNIYIRRSPKGHLYYRDYDGNLIDELVTGPVELGQKISEQNDMYVCAAQRYYKFLTGISIPVANQTGTSFYLKHRQKIIELGLKLKEHGSLKQLITDILKTPAFQTRNPALELEQEAN